jgi:uncharacterized protein (TIRG00374 family)
LISAVLLWLAIRKVDVQEVGSALHGADRVAAAGAGLLLLLTFPVLAVRWAGLARRLEPPNTTFMLELSLAGVAINNTFPGRLGEFARAGGLSRRTGRRFPEAFGTVVVDRICDVLVLMLLFGATFAAVPDAAWVRWLGVAAMLATAIVVALVVIIVVLLRTRPERFAGAGWARTLLRTFAQGLDCVPDMRAAARALGLTALAWSIWILAAIVAAGALGITMTLMEAAFLAAVLNLGTAIPSSPGFIGTYQWLAVSAMGLFGVSADDAFAFSILFQVLWLVPTTVAGILVMLHLGLTPNMLRRAAQESSEASG